MKNMPKKLQKCSVVLMITAMVSLISGLSAMVVPHPLYKNPPNIKPSRPSEKFGPRESGKTRNLPQNILVLRVQFADVSFASVAAYPDYLVHDQAFFERWMTHLTDFYGDASHYQYIINYTMPETIITLPNTMAYYGGDTSEISDARVPDMILAAIQMADQTIDYSQYDAIIMFHAGAGQESDVSSARKGEIWSTFISRSDLQEAFDPENDNYPGITTNDGTIVNEIVLIPESEYQDYFPGEGEENASAYLFSIYGVLCHQFGHQIGLPTLFDNVSSNGRSQGIGNWGLMGTGVWNGNGNVPAQLEAWSRYYLGWEQAQTITGSMQNLTVDYFLNQSAGAQRLYKIPISDHEYFLIENRQQNPDNSLDPYNGQPSFTFTLLSPEEQDYYPAPDSLLPYFNFMENRYKGCEWDFFLPGLGGPIPEVQSYVADGSGLLIWHIDENIINANFDPGFDYNHVNGDAAHKGVDLEEADGIQQLDTATYSLYKYGSPYDSFRNDANNPDANNTYFGDNNYSGLLHLPTAESYYGGIPVEIYDISQSGLQMTFSVRFGWKLDTESIGINELDACPLDFDGDGVDEIFYPMTNGDLYIWKNEELMSSFPHRDTEEIKSYSWDGQSLLIASQLQGDTAPYVPYISLRKLNTHTDTSVVINQSKLIAPIVNINEYVAVPLKSTGADSKIWMIKTDSLNILSHSYHVIPDSICTNLVYFKQKILSISRGIDSYHLNKVTPLDFNTTDTQVLTIPVDSTIVAISGATITPNGEGDLVIQTPYAVYLTDLSGNVRNGYPRVLPFYCNFPVSISDIDKNGSFDMLISGENTFAILDYSGANILTNFAGLPLADTLGITSGVLAGDYDGDGKMEFLGSFSRNRLAMWDDNQHIMSSFPVSFSYRSRNLPFIHKASDSIVYAWIPTDNGKIYRTPLPEEALSGIDTNWYCKFANLKRTASREDASPPNNYQTSSLFVQGQVYVFPNPLKPIYSQNLTFQIMTSRDAKVEVSIHNISGTELFNKKILCKAWLSNKELVDFPVDHLTSGVYIAVIKSGNDVKRIKFAVEK